MITRSYSGSIAVDQLHDELLAALPELGPVDGWATLIVQGDAGRVTLTFPDRVDVARVDDVVARHRPAPPPLPPPAPDPLAVARELANAVLSATDFDAAKANVADVVATFPDPPTV